MQKQEHIQEYENQIGLKENLLKAKQQLLEAKKANDQSKIEEAQKRVELFSLELEVYNIEMQVQAHKTYIEKWNADVSAQEEQITKLVEVGLNNIEKVLTRAKQVRNNLRAMKKDPLKVDKLTALINQIEEMDLDNLDGEDERKFYSLFQDLVSATGIQIQ